MRRINWNNLPEDPDGMTFADTQKAYKKIYQQLLECRRMKSATQNVLHKTVQEDRELKKEKQILTRRVQTITKKAAANKSFKETSGWSAGAIGFVTLLWAAGGQYGFPGPQWLFEHEIVYGAACWLSTTLFAFAAKGFYGAD